MSSQNDWGLYTSSLQALDNLIPPSWITWTEFIGKDVFICLYSFKCTIQFIEQQKETALVALTCVRVIESESFLTGVSKAHLSLFSCSAFIGSQHTDLDCQQETPLLCQSFARVYVSSSFLAVGRTEVMKLPSKCLITHWMQFFSGALSVQAYFIQ